MIISSKPVQENHLQCGWIKRIYCSMNSIPKRRVFAQYVNNGMSFGSDAVDRKALVPVGEPRAQWEQ